MQISKSKVYNCSVERLGRQTSLTIYDDIAVPSSYLYAHQNGGTELEARRLRRLQAKHDIYERREAIVREATRTRNAAPVAASLFVPRLLFLCDNFLQSAARGCSGLLSLIPLEACVFGGGVVQGLWFMVRTTFSCWG